MIKYTGIKNILENLDIDINQVYAAYSFYNPKSTNNYIYPDSWATNSATGILNNNNGFDNFSGSGNFDGSTYMYLSGKEFTLNDSLVFLSYEKKRIANEILLTSFTGDSFTNYSGFTLGVNTANKLYFSYWNNVEGLFTFTYSKILADKNLIALSRKGPILSIGKYNNNTFDFETEEFNIFQDVFIESNELYLGGAPVKNDFNQNDLNFSGIIDKFFFIKSNDLYFYKEPLAIGLFSNITDNNQQGEQYCFETGFFSGSGFLYSGVLETFLSGYEIAKTGITGYQFFSSGYTYSGITGYENISIGFYIDNCNVTQELFTQIPLSGLIFSDISYNKPLTGTIYESGFIEITKSGLLSGEKQIWISGAYCSQDIINISDSGEVVDINYLPSLSYRQISLLKEINPGSYIETFLETYTGTSLNYNKDLIYDSLNKNYFYFEDPIKNNILLFANGQNLIDSGFNTVVNGYNINIDPKFDFYFSGNFIETAGFYENKDFLFYDDIEVINSFVLTGISSNIIEGNFIGNFFIFMNGQKLIENIDYQKNNTQIILDNNINLDNDDKFLFIKFNNDKFNNYLTTESSDKRYVKQSNFIINNEGKFTRMAVGLSGYIIPLQSPLESGKFYIYTPRENIPPLQGPDWTIQQTIFNNSIGNGSLGFDNILAINDFGNIIALSTAPIYNTYLYTGSSKDSWSLKQTIPNVYSEYLSFDKNGEILCTQNTLFTGSISDNWVQKQIFQNTGNFGWSSKLNKDGNTLIISALLDGEGGQNAGALYVYTGSKYSEWEVKQKITGSVNAQFGFATNLNFDGSIIAVSTAFKGETHIYTKNINSNWILKQVIPNTIGRNMEISDNGEYLFLDSISGVLVYKGNKNNGWELNQLLPMSVSINLPNSFYSQSNSLFFSIEGTSSFLSNKFLSLHKLEGEFISTINLNNNFNHSCSQVYLNGVRQKINNNYIENANFDLISGNLYKKENLDIIYNNTDDFLT
jgi:hypothetical protein